MYRSKRKLLGFSSKGSGFINFAFLIAIALVLGFLYSAIVSGIDVTVKISGRIVPTLHKQIVQHFEGGNLSEILIHEGQNIEEGQALFRLDETVWKAEHRFLLKKYSKLLAKEIHLLSEVELMDAVALFVEIEEIGSEDWRKEQELFKMRLLHLNNKISEAEIDKNLAVMEYNELVFKSQNLVEELNVQKEILNLNRKLLESGVGSETEYLNAESSFRELSTKKNANDLQIDRYKLRLKEFSIEKTSITSEYILDAQNRLVVTQRDLLNLDQQMVKLSDRIKRLTITAPYSGYVNRIYANTIGGGILPNEALAEITPSNTKLVLEGYLSPEDRNNAFIGQDVYIRLDAYDFTIYGVVIGEVVNISADTIMHGANNIKEYRIRIDIDEGSIPQNITIKAGMSAEAQLLLRNISIFEYIAKPIRRNFESFHKLQ